MVHGAGGGGWEYDKWRPVFKSAGFNVIARDLVPAPGGLSHTTFDDYLQQVITWSTRPEPVILVGASMGGMLAIKAAQRIKSVGVVLVNSVAPLGVGKPRVQTKQPPVVRWANGPLKDTRDSMPDSDEKTIQWAWKRWRDESGQVMTALQKGVPAAKPGCPALVVLGDKDTDVPPATGVALAGWSNADLLRFAGMSHVGPLLGTRAEEVAHHVALWCRNR